MIKRIFSVLLTFVLLCIMSLPVSAADKSEVKIDGSELTYKETSKGTTNLENLVRGTHLMDGECSITKAGRGKIYVYASTTANHTVDYVSAILYVDQYNPETGYWEQIAYWQVEDKDTYYVSTSKLLTVESGYFYRVHASHVAGMKADYPYEEATSLTDGILID